MTEPESQIGIFTTDANLVVRSWDSWLEQVTGLKSSEACGQPIGTLFPDLEQRGLLARLQRVVTEGTVEVLAPAFHSYFISCPTRTPSKRFDLMQQRVMLAALRECEQIIGTIVTIEDVTERIEREQELSEQMTSGDDHTRLRAASELAARHTTDATEPLFTAIGDDSWRVRRVAVSGLAGRVGASSVTDLLRAMREQHRNLSVLNSALQLLVSSGVDIIAPMTEFLKCDDTDLRIYAALALGETHDPVAVEPLIDALKDQDANVRYQAIESLGKLRAREAIRPMLEILRSRDFFFGFAAIDALTRIGDSSVAPALAPLLEDEMLRAPAVDALGALGDEEIIAPLIALLNTEGAPAAVIAQSIAALYDRYEKFYDEGSYIADLARHEVNATGAQNLLSALSRASSQEMRPLVLVSGWLEGAKIECALVELLGQPVARKEVIEAVVRHGARVVDLLIEQLRKGDLDTRKAAVIALERIGDRRAVPALVRAMDEDAELVVVIAGALAKIGDRRAFEPLIALLASDDAAVRQSAIAALNSLGHPDMPARCRELLVDRNPLARESAAKIAGYFGYQECVELLIERCSDSEESVRRAAIEHLPYLDDERAIDLLVHATGNDCSSVRAAAARALGQVNDPIAMPYLLDALKDRDDWVRYFAARSIGRHCFTEAIDRLAGLAREDESGHVRVAAIDALGQIGGPRVISLLAPMTESDNDDIARAALSALGAMGHPDALPPIFAAIRGQDKRRRVDAIRSLGQRGGAHAVGTLQWVAAGDEDADIAQAAIDSLARLATPEAIDALVALTASVARRAACVDALASQNGKQIEFIARGLERSHPVVRAAVVDALARMKDERATRYLMGALEDVAPSVRKAAASALRHLGNRGAERKLAQMARADADPVVRQAAERALRR